jgi:ParB-like chromosome segregation protein Spo0J
VTTLRSTEKIEAIAIEKLIPYARNSRTHSDEQIAQISGSIKEFGFNNPVLIDADDGIIAGHGRVLAARKLGLDKVPCIRLGHLNDTQKKAYIIADNKIALNSGWNDEMLKLELEELKRADFDTTLIGWATLPDFDAAADYSVLEADVDAELDAMSDGVKKAIQIEFDPDEYQEAQELVKYWRERGASVGSMIVGFLRAERNKL